MSNLNYYPKRPDRLVEYFVVVGLGEDVTPLQTDSGAHCCKLRESVTI